LSELGREYHEKEQIPYDRAHMQKRGAETILRGLCASFVALVLKKSL
jgi:hypothetical protein